jgi:predicted glycoside hydrolase/deacetylase ChbG (UPF0249 family)
VAEREARHLIVNGDDFGMSSGVSRGIVEAHRRGILTSTSLMVERPAAEEAAGLARALPDLSVGLHLELEGTAAVAPSAAIGEQLRRFEQLMGGPPSHLDSHHDVHREPNVLPHALEAAQRLGIPLRGHSAAQCITGFYGQWDGETQLETVSVEHLVNLLVSDVAARVRELMCHPGYADAELRSSYAKEREQELRTLCDARIPAALAEHGIRLLGFRNLAALDAGQA